MIVLHIKMLHIIFVTTLLSLMRRIKRNKLIPCRQLEKDCNLSVESRLACLFKKRGWYFAGASVSVKKTFPTDENSLGMPVVELWSISGVAERKCIMDHQKLAVIFVPWQVLYN